MKLTQSSGLQRFTKCHFSSMDSEGIDSYAPCQQEDVGLPSVPSVVGRKHGRRPNEVWKVLTDVAEAHKMKATTCKHCDAWVCHNMKNVAVSTTAPNFA